MKREFTQPSAAVRSVFAAVAIVITASIGGFIDHLATSYGTASHLTVQATTPPVVALAARR